MERRIISKNFHGKHTAGLFLKERGWGTDFLPIKGTSNPSSTCNEEENLLLVPYSWMGSARGKNGIREMTRVGKGKRKIDIYHPSFSLMHFCPSPVSPILLICSDKAMVQFTEMSYVLVFFFKDFYNLLPLKKGRGSLLGGKKTRTCCLVSVIVRC